MTSDAAQELLAILPYARRYARALTGSQAEGDKVVARVLAQRRDDLPPRLSVYAGISKLAQVDVGAGRLSLRQRQLLLLTALEELSLPLAARVLGMAEAAAATELQDARAALKASAASAVLIIEDEPVIAMELRMLVEGCGHRVVGVATSEAEAVRLMQAERAGLILADVNLGRGGNGIIAVRRILETMPVPVIFVTGYPELLLTAERIEPAFVMRKPFDPLTLAISTYQAINAGRVPIH